MVPSGARSLENLPVNRGFDSHFGFLKGGEDHYTQHNEEAGEGSLVDLWRNHGPAFGENGTFSGYLYAQEAVRVIEDHAANYSSRPLFVYLAWHLVHSPLEAPSRFLDPSCSDNKDRQLYHGMVTAMDEGIGNVTAALRRAAMYDNTLIVFSADNGGPLVTTGESGNNFPLRGGKTCDFEGGTRAASFISGGFVPSAARGTVNHAYLHIADWYATFAHLAGVDPADSRAGAHGSVPAIDSINVWPALVTPGANETDSPRQEIVLAYGCAGSPGSPEPTAHCPDMRGANDSAMISGQYKIVFGPQNNAGFWTGPIHPNGTTDPAGSSTHCGPFSCCQGCLFDIWSDPTEHFNLRDSLPGVFQSLRTLLAQRGATMFQTNHTAPNLTCITAQESYRYYRHFDGPRCFQQVPPMPPPPPPPQQYYLRHGALCLFDDPLRLHQCAPEARVWSSGHHAFAANGKCLKVHEAPSKNCSRDGMNLFMGICGGHDPENGFILDPEGRLQSGTCSRMCIGLSAEGSLDLLPCNVAGARGWEETAA